MNNEKNNQIIDEVYENYTNYPLATIHDHHTNILYQNRDKGWCMLIGRSIVSPHPTRHLTKEEFINKIKTDVEFANKWGLKIEERKLSLDERMEIWRERTKRLHIMLMWSGDKTQKDSLNEQNIPTKLITLTYNNEKIEVYE